MSLLLWRRGLWEEAGFSKFSLPKVATFLYSSVDTEKECSSILHGVQGRGTLVVTAPGTGVTCWGLSPDVYLSSPLAP